MRAGQAAGTAAQTPARRRPRRGAEIGCSLARRPHSRAPALAAAGQGQSDPYATFDAVAGPDVGKFHHCPDHNPATPPRFAGVRWFRLRRSPARCVRTWLHGRVTDAERTELAG